MLVERLEVIFPKDCFTSISHGLCDFTDGEIGDSKETIVVFVPSFLDAFA